MTAPRPHAPGTACKDVGGRVVVGWLGGGVWGIHLQGCPDFGQLEPKMGALLPRLPNAVRRDLPGFHESIQSRSRDAYLPHDLGRSDHFLFVPHDPSVAVDPIVPRLGHMVHLRHIRQEVQSGHSVRTAAVGRRPVLFLCWGI